MNTDQPITSLKGIGPKTAQKFAGVGIETIGDLLRYYPRTYVRFEEPVGAADLQEGMTAAILVRLIGQPVLRYAGKYRLTLVKVRSVTDSVDMDVTWFNMPYMKNAVRSGQNYIFRGSVKRKGSRITLSQPQVYTPEEYSQKTQKLLPVYPLTAGLTENMVTRAVEQAMECISVMEDPLPDELREKYALLPYAEAVQTVHFPKDEQQLKRARERLVFDEFLLFILSVRRMREQREQIYRTHVLHKTAAVQELIDQLPYELTGAQKQVWMDVETDMTKQRVMSRLIQGDVGSGKTIIAFMALLMAAENGGQGAMMAPTEVLARQHYESWETLRRTYGLQHEAVLLTGSMKVSEKRSALERIRSGEASVIIGTHALIQEAVEYHDLMLVITDEQHRFGVRQRETLAIKGERPHMLVMSATPIPRTLAVILYGDLDISIMREMPGGRRKIKTAVVDVSYRPNAYRFIQEQIIEGRQAYVICPMVEQSEGMDAENVTDYAEKLRGLLPDTIQVGILHGRMKSTEKNQVMNDFLHNRIQVLVSTTVVEVGVNVPNATVMMIENADHFGLAQLHQLRGRVGRGDWQSYCILVHSAGSGQTSRRLEIMHSSNDGFEIAQKDLELRGPGDLFGIRQSGELAFAMADIYQDASTLETAQKAAAEILMEDARLESQKYSKLRKYLRSTISEETESINI